MLATRCQPVPAFRLTSMRIPTRAALGLHCLVTGVVATVGVSLASVVDHGPDPLSDPGRWLL